MELLVGDQELQAEARTGLVSGIREEADEEEASWITVRRGRPHLAAVACSAGLLIAALVMSAHSSARAHRAGGASLQEWVAPIGSTPQWSYKAFHYGDWVEKYPLCSGNASLALNNQWQSPIEIRTGRLEYDNVSYPMTSDTLRVSPVGGGCYKVEMLSDSHTFEASFEDTNCSNLTIVWKNETYVMSQLHFHVESENMVDGAHLPGELHMVHHAVNDTSRLLVLGVFIMMTTDKSEADPFIDDLLEEGFVPEHVYSTAASRLNPYEVMREGETFYSFMGSLTTPPCTANIPWLLMRRMLRVFGPDWADFVKYLRNSTEALQADSYGYVMRPTQPLNNRPITVGSVSLTSSR